MTNTAFHRHKRKTASALLTAVCAALFAGGFSAHAQAGFLRDFYDDVGAQSNSTAAGIHQSTTMHMMTGGRYVVKVPRTDFQPFYMQAPELKAGCGGIDVFLGAFSVPSKEEFVNFLRSIGTALPGLAFQLALQSLAPDLNEQVSQFRDMLMRLSRESGDSCRAARTILDSTGATGWLTGMGERARNSLRHSGSAEDQSDAESMTRTDGGTVLGNVPVRSDSDGNVIEASEMNLTWALLSGGKGGARLSQERRETMMSLVGTTLFLKSGEGESTVTEERSLPPLDVLASLLGDRSGPALPADAFVYTCDEPLRCLNPRRAAMSDINLSHAVYSAMVRYRESIRTRNPRAVTEEDLILLEGISSMPLLQFAELSASPRLIGFSDTYLQTYAEAAAYEAVLAALTQLASDVQRIARGSSGRHANTFSERHAAEIESRTALLLYEMKSRETALVQKMSRLSAFLQEVNHINRIVYGDPASDLAAGLTAGSSLR